MGKIRVAALGSEEDEKALQEKQRIKREEKKKREAAAVATEPPKKRTMYEDEIAEIEAIARMTQKSDTKDEAIDANATSEKNETKEGKEKKATKVKVHHRSKKYQSLISKVEQNKLYGFDAAMKLLREVSMAKFGGAVEVHLNTVEKGLRGSVQLPHGTGKEVRVKIATLDTVEALVKDVESGKIEFDALVAHPAVMSKLAKVAKILGPRGLMPNPKNGTVNPKPEEVAAKLIGGEINWKTESEFPIIHQVIGRLAFSDDQLQDNFKAIVKSIGVSKIKTVTIKSTISPGIKVQV